jgi:hypothetical protein
MSGRGRAGHVAERLSDRDFLMLGSLRDLRLMSGEQLGRRYFAGGQPVTQARKTRSALRRLSELGLVVRLTRRVGGVRAGSQGFVYGLSGLGQAVLDLGQTSPRRHRRVIETKPAFAAHVLAVAELWVSLQERADELFDLEFVAEPGCWRRFSGLGGQVITLKPDAYVRLVTAAGEWEVAAFIEQDLDTESLPTILRKLGVYVAYWQAGEEQRRFGLFPKVWWLVPTSSRAAAITRTIQRLPEGAQPLFCVCLANEAAERLTQPPTEGGAR